MSANSTWAVEAHGLVKNFGSNRAVDGVDLSVRTGSVYGVLGPNGAGKTTMISMLATLLKPDAGSAQIFGHDVQKEAQTVRQLLGVTAQFASVDERLSATENLVIFSRLPGLPRAQAKRKSAELLEGFGLSDAATRPISKFSGGMRRCLDLAASLIAQPPLIFLNEPTTGLDPRTRAQMWDTIRRLVAIGSTGTQLREDMDKGVFDRFKSMPIARIAPLAGAPLADTIRYAIATTLTFVMGYIMGYRPDGSLGFVVLAGLAVIVCAWSISWIVASFVVIVRSASSVQGTSMLVLFPLTFLSNAFVSVDTMPAFLQRVVTVNPVSHLVTAVRELANNGTVGMDMVWSLVGAGVVVAIMAPLTVRTYMRKA